MSDVTEAQIKVTTGLLDQLYNAAISDPMIWVPVIIGWGAGGLMVLVLNKKEVRRKADRELPVYGANASVAFAVYLGANFSPTLLCVQQALFAGAIAVILPFVWFKFIKPRQGKSEQ